MDVHQLAYAAVTEPTLSACALLALVNMRSIGLRFLVPHLLRPHVLANLFSEGSLQVRSLIAVQPNLLLGRLEY